MSSLQRTLSETFAFGQLKAAAAASIDILPFQLEPALALILGRASRFLLADEVGLGKTIQAGLMLAELRLRGWGERALIVTPSGLRRQWADELQRRFETRSEIIDAAALASLTKRLPRHINAWCAAPVCITSIDFIKQPEVLHSVRQLVWDILIVDEAHQAAPATRRYEAVNVIAGRARHVVLITATPHDGDEAAFSALCNIGRLDLNDRILLFRRTRRQAGLERRRRVHLMRIRLSPPALVMHRLLDKYVARLWDIAARTGRLEAKLTAMVLSKRAFSSAASLAISIERRLSALERTETAAVQTALPFEPDTDTDREDEPPELSFPAFHPPDQERAALLQLLHAARLAAPNERKIVAITTLLRRVSEPIVVFTEYRDTLAALHSALAPLRTTGLLHGGLTTHERLEVVDAFNNGAVDLLLATDAGAEGLNLQKRCRVVVNLELPWNPMRLEQRIGRVDRIGQARAVHAFNFFASSTRESTVLAALFRRVDRIRTSEIEIAAAMISSTPIPIRGEHPPASATATVDLHDRATAETARLQLARHYSLPRTTTSNSIVPVTSVRRLAATAPIICVVRVRITSEAGRLLEDALMPLAIQLRSSPRPSDLRRPREVQAAAQSFINAAGAAVMTFVAQRGEERARQIGRELAGGIARAVQREHLISKAGAAELERVLQPGLFDKRATSQRQLAQEEQELLTNECLVRTALLQSDAMAVVAHTEIAFLLVAC